MHKLRFVYHKTTYPFSYPQRDIFNLKHRHVFACYEKNYIVLLFQISAITSFCRVSFPLYFEPFDTANFSRNFSFV